MSIFRLNDAVSKVTPGNAEVAPKEEVSKTKEERSGGDSDNQGVVKEIVLKGPMSHAFTEVLNILLDRKTNPEGVLRAENSHMALTALEAMEEDEENADLENAARAYVYVYNGKTMTLGDVVNMVEKALEDRQAHPKSEVAVVVNNAEKVIDGKDTSRAMSMATQQFRQEGVRLFFRQEKALDWVASAMLKGKAC